MFEANVKNDTARISTNYELRVQYKVLIEGIMTLNRTVEERLEFLEEKQAHHDKVVDEIKKEKALLEEQRSQHDAKMKRDNEMLGKKEVKNNIVKPDVKKDMAVFHESLCQELGEKLSFMNQRPLPRGEGAAFPDHSYYGKSDEISTDRNQRVSTTPGLRSRWTSTRSSPVCFRWNPSRCSTCVKVKNEGRTIVNTGNTWGIAFGNTPNQPVFSVRMENVDLGFRVGYVLGDLEQKNATLHSLDRNGWFINSEGRLFSCNGDANRVYTNPIMVGDVVTVLHNRSSETISFEINGRACSVAFSQVKCHAGLLFPCVGLFSSGCASIVPFGENFPCVV